MPIIAGENIADWWMRPVPLSKGLVAWQGKIETGTNVFTYLSWWDNPHLKKKITSLEFISTEGRGYMILIGLTAMPKQQITCRRRQVEEIKKQLSQRQAIIEQMNFQIRKLYRKIMLGADVEKVISRLSTDYLQKWIQAYQKHLDLYTASLLNARKNCGSDICDSRKEPI